MESIVMVNKSTIMAPKETFKNAMEFLDKNNPSCALYSTDGYKMNVHKVRKSGEPWALWYLLINHFC